MNTHPAKLLVIYPIYTVEEYRRHLTAIDDMLMVHYRADGHFLLELRPMVKLTTRGAHSFGAALRKLADDLDADYRVIIVDRDQYLADLERLARQYATRNDGDAIERAVQAITERTRHQILDSLFDAPAQYVFARVALSRRPRRTRAQKFEASGLNCQNGIPTPRSEMLWHSLRHQWCSPRTRSAALATWERWCRANRPAMPEADG